MQLGPNGAKLLTVFTSSDKTIFTRQQVIDLFSSEFTADTTIKHLVAGKWIQRLEHGLFMILPLEAGPDRVWSESSFVIASNLVDGGVVSYWSAMRYWDMTEQLPKTQFVQTTKRKKSVTIMGIKYQFVTVREDLLFGITKRKINQLPILVTDREKTIIDAAHRLDLSGGTYQLAQALIENQEEIDWKKVDEYLVKWGGGTVPKRLGYLVEHLNLQFSGKESILSHWQSMITKGISQLEPGLKKKGPISYQWNIQVNVQGLEHQS